MTGRSLVVAATTNSFVTTATVFFGIARSDGWWFQVRWIAKDRPTKLNGQLAVDWGFISFEGRVYHIVHLWLPLGHRLFSLQGDNATRSTENHEGRTYVTFLGLAEKGWQFYWKAVLVPPEVRLQVRLTNPLDSWNLSDIRVDGQPVKTSNGFATLFLKTDQVHAIEIPLELYLTDEVRVIFVKWSDGATTTTRTIALVNDLSLEARYAIEYKLTVLSDYGKATGSGWYPANSKVSISVDPATGFPVRHVFDHWAGIENGTYPSMTFLMDGPKTVRAIWRDDYGQLIQVSTAAEAAAVILAILLYRRRRRLKERDVDKTKVY